MAENKNAVVEYTADGQKIRLTPDTVQKFLLNGNSKITEQEFVMFASLCKAKGLNPFLREAYLVKYGDTAQIITGKDALFKRADNNPDYDGIESGVIVEDKDGNIKNIEGTFMPKGSTLLGAWAKVYRKSQSHPRSVSVNFNEYCKVGKDGKPMSSWASMPAIMIEKVAKVSALREAFPNEFSGMYVAEEFSGRNYSVDSSSGEVLDVKVNEVSPELATPNQVELIKEKVADDLENVLAFYGVENVEELTLEQASEILKLTKSEE